MERNLADYIYTNLDRIADITPDIEKRLNVLFDAWNAREITVQEFREQNGFNETTGIYSFIPYMTEYLVDRMQDKVQANSMNKQNLYFLENILYNLNCINQLMINEKVIIESYRDLVVGEN